jgi:hypothetical protein
MKKYFLILILILAVLISAGFVFAKIEKDSDKDGLSDNEEQKVYQTNPNKADTDSDNFKDAEEIYHGYSPLTGGQAKLTQLILDIAYINEAPDDNWTGPWKNACEEASMAMVEKFYTGKNPVSVKEAKTFMITLFDKQNKIWGSNADSDAQRTAKLINDYTSYNAVIKNNPTALDIKKELQQKHPIISLHYGKDLQNKNIPFLATGSYYHMMVITGYDDIKEEFIVNDTGDRVAGKNHRYNYDLFIDSLHDFDFKTRKANGPARVIFTYPKLVKTIESPKVYYLHSNEMQYIPNEQIFKAKGWKWEAVNLAAIEWLDTFTKGKDIKI